MYGWIIYGLLYVLLKEKSNQSDYSYFDIPVSGPHMLVFPYRQAARCKTLGFSPQITASSSGEGKAPGDATS